MNCAWCGANDDGSDSHGICDSCMISHFGIDPGSIQQETTSNEDESYNQ